MRDLKIAIIVADVDEYKPLAERIERKEYENYSFLGRKGHKFIIKTDKGSATVYSILCGIGMINAAAAAAHFKTIGCDIILNYGLSGGINGVKRGDLMLGNKFVEHDFDLSGIGYKLCEKPNQEYVYTCDSKLNTLMQSIIPDIKLGTAVSGDRFICDEKVRERLMENFDAMSCDMETAAIAYVCNFGDIPFLALRRISDDAGDNAADSYREMNHKAETVLSDIILDFIPFILNQ
ncbi:MAG: 5'-methylthioadenosine/S-adenosylhomocysteine nucleosidase [Clostridia bacterium]|nr:5'-methylthioadenosine/S-adenosylhomocysteine nucleosidase [Clostridia bacterium]